MRRTKIVCTLGPATDNDTVLRDLITAGMNVARFNFSHGTHDEHTMRLDMCRQASRDLGIPIALLLDIKGPKIRIGKFQDGRINLEKGKVFTITTDEVPGDVSRVSVSYKRLPSEVERGDRILIADGLIELKVVSRDERNIECQVLFGGELSDRKGVNVPDVNIGLPFLSDQDREDLLFGIRHDYDFIGASFTRSADDVNDIRKFLEDNGGRGIKIVAKIENREGVKNIDSIIRAVDGIMVARGDMGVEIPLEELPAIQKVLIQKASLAGKPVITATQMLESMIKNPRATRAEVTDVANAIYDGTSAIMLSGETSVGANPVDAVEMMSRIAVEAEKDINYIERFDTAYVTISKNVTNAISQATCISAHALGAAAIITITRSGHTARMVSKYRPACPIIATTTSERVMRQLALSWGVTPHLMEEEPLLDRLFQRAVDISVEKGLLAEGDLAVITGGSPMGASGTTNILKIQMVGDVLVEGRGIHGLTASGNVFVIDRDDGFSSFHEGDIIVMEKTTDDMLHLLKNAGGIITEEPAQESKAVIAGKTLGIPVITDAANAASILKSGIVVTVDGKSGRVYSGERELKP